MNDSRNQEDRQRLDRWLWHGRFFRSRALAAKAVAGGHVKVGSERVKPGHRVKVGDRLEIVRNRERFVLEVASLGRRRGSAAEARATYVEDPEARRAREALQKRLRQDRLAMPRTEGRPDKHTRRLLLRRQRGEP